MNNIHDLVNVTTFIQWCDYLGTFAFAVSGIRLAAGKGFDWFGAYVVGLVTAVGGGTIRDILITSQPFWLFQPSYLIITGLSLVVTILLSKYLVRMNHTLFFFDSIGLGLFTVVGIAKTFDAGLSWWIAITMGIITGSFGGMIRDILIQEIPLIFRKDFYAVACACGGILYVSLLYMKILPLFWIQAIVVAFVVILRFLAVIYHLHIPNFTVEKHEKKKHINNSY